MRCLRGTPDSARHSSPVLLSASQIARVLGVSDASSARRAIARWRACGVATQALPSTGGRCSHGVAVGDVGRMVGLRDDVVLRLAGVAATDGRVAA